VSVIDAATNTVLIPTISVGSFPAGVAVTPNGGQVYVANTGSDTVSVIDTTTNTVVTTIPVGPGPVGVAVDPGGKHVFVTNNAEIAQGAPGANTVSVIDTSSTAVVTGVPPVGQHPLGVVATATNVYVAHIGADIVSVIDI
jgi:YVTN family beta-propeller protein